MKTSLFTRQFHRLLAGAVTIMLLPAVSAAAPDNAQKRLEPRAVPFSTSDVRLTDSPFRQAQATDMRYMLALDADRLLAPYLKEAGLPPKAENYPNWENTGLDGHIGGHYLSALSFMYAATGNKEVKERLDYTLGELKRAQDASGDGYLCGVPDGRRIWDEISRGDIRAGGFDLNGGWVPLYNIHKIFAGLRDAWQQTGNTTARDMLVKLTDWMLRITAGLSDEQVQQMLVSEHGGLNEIFADVADITGDSKYLDMARRFTHRQVTDPLTRKEDHLTGMHANTQIPKIIGLKRIADMTGDTILDGAAEYFWETVTGRRSVSIGGNSVREHFHPAGDFGSMLTSEQGPETCNTYNMLRLTRMLYATTGDRKFADYYERALYNHILSSQNPDEGGFVYFTPMRPGHYRVYSRPQSGFWCCVGSGLENHARYGEMIYAHSGADTLVVNLFIPSVLTWGERTVTQTNSFPEEEGTTLTIGRKDGKNPGRFTLSVRMPGWTDPQGVTMTVNGKPVKFNARDGYAVMTRKWNNGDKVHVGLPMHLIAEPLPDRSRNYSFVYGPMVLGAQTGTGNQTGLFADDSRGGHIAEGEKIPLHRLPAIIEPAGDITGHVTKTSDNPLKFSLHGVTLPEYEGMKLVPFHRLHKCRYMVYWPVYTPAEWEVKKEEILREENRLAELERITVDKVTCGEQQPESDHFIKMEDSGSWDDDGRRWREARGWFAYSMRDAKRDARKIRVTYRPEKGKTALVYANGIPAGKTRGDESGSKEITEDFPIPADAASDATIEIRIRPEEGGITPHIYEIRLLK